MANGAGETKKDPSAWTPDLILALMEEKEERYQERFDHLEQLLTERWQAHQAVHVQEEETRRETAGKIDVRLEGLNELRREVIADRALFVSREAFDAREDMIDDRLATRKEQFDSRIALLHDQITEWRGREKGLLLLVGGAAFVSTLIAIYSALS